MKKGLAHVHDHSSPLRRHDTFGCKLTTSGMGTYYIVGVISAAHATDYGATITGLDNGTPVFTCVEFDDSDSAQLRVAKKLGALQMTRRRSRVDRGRQPFLPLW